MNFNPRLILYPIFFHTLHPRGKQHTSGLQDFTRLHNRNFKFSQNFKRLPKTSKDFKRLQKTSRDFKRLQGTSRDFKRLHETLRTSRDFIGLHRFHETS
jgi:hypothetical protein